MNLYCIAADRDITLNVVAKNVEAAIITAKSHLLKNWHGSHEITGAAVLHKDVIVDTTVTD